MESCNLEERDHEGFGPRISKRAEQQLSRSCYPMLGCIACSYRNGVLVLEGRLPSYYLKQIAQELVFQVDGVDAVVNQIEVAAARNRSRM